MFILQTAPYEVASPDNELRVFGTLEEAKAEMERQIRARAEEAGCERAFEEDDGDEFDDPYVTESEERYVFSIDDMAWIIHEVPGYLIPEDTADGFREDIAYAANAYESCGDAYEADRRCQEVCWEISAIIGSKEE